MKRLILILLVVCCILGCDKKSDEHEELVVSEQKTDDTNKSAQKNLLWNSVANKVWIKETWSGGEVYEDISFVIIRVEQGKLEGQFLESGIITPDSNLYSEKQNTDSAFSGSYNEHGAELILEGSKGKLYISPYKENLLSVDIQYTGEIIKTFKFKPYNLNDLEKDNRAKFDNDITDITLKKWGKVKFVSVVRTGIKRNTLFIYLTDCKGNILYDFSDLMAFPNDFKVNDFLFKDINDDGREDLLLILGGITDSELHEIIIYEQNEMGGFDVNLEKTQKTNFKMNKDKKYSIRNIVSYLDAYN